MAGPPPFDMSQKKGIVGLTNIGNTCYGNATLQALRHQVDMTIFLLQGQHMDVLKHKIPSDRTNLLQAYASLVKDLWTAESGVAATRPFWGAMIPAAIKSGFEQFRIPMAHDAHEFLVFLLDEFHEALKEEVQMTIRNTGEGEIRSALEFWKGAFEKNYSPLVELAFGLTRKSVCCSGCKKESVSWETLNILKVSVPKQADPVDLIDLVKAEGKGEEIEGYSCDHCKPTRHNAQINRALWRLGNWVIVTLKRNENNGRRINTNVNIPLTLSFGSAFHPSSQELSATDPYELFATIHHHGSAGGGHYTAHARHPVTGAWAHYDDESSHILQGGPHLDASTYIVMYKRMSGGVKEEDKAKEA